MSDLPYPSDINRPSLASQLRARYPGIRILECYQHVHHNGTEGLSIRFQAPRERLVEAGLATNAMFEECVQRSHRGFTTEFGEHCGLYSDIDAQSRPGCWDLTLYRAVEGPDDLRADGMAATKKIQREVAKLIRRAGKATPSAAPDL